MPRPSQMPRPSLMDNLQSPGNSLLSKQLANITDTLLSASKRRDTAAREVARRELSRPSTPTPAVHTPPTAPLADFQLFSSPTGKNNVTIGRAASESQSVSQLTVGNVMSASDELTEMMQELDKLSVQFKATSNLPSEDCGEKKDLETLCEE